MRKMNDRILPFSIHEETRVQVHVYDTAKADHYIDLLNHFMVQ